MNVCEFCHEDKDGYLTHLNREGIGSAHITQSHPINGGWKLCVSSGKQVRMTIKQPCFTAAERARFQVKHPSSPSMLFPPPRG